MDAEETRSLMADACDALPRLRGYVDTAPDGGGMILAAWTRGLASVDVRDASEVLFGIASNEQPLPEGFLWENFPGLVRDRCKSLRYAMSREARQRAAQNRDSTYACGLCLDTGFARIYHPGFTRSYVLYGSCRQRLQSLDPNSREALQTEWETWRKAVRATGRRRTSLTMATLCTCELGDRHTERHPDVIRYDASRAAIARTSTPRDITDWIASRNTPTEWSADEWT